MVQTVNTCEELITQIDTDGIDATVRAHRKPPLPTRILRDLYELYHDQDRYVTFLAHYPLIPSDLADQIAQQFDPSNEAIATGLAANPRSPQQSLKRLADHPSATVRCALAANPNLTPKEFQTLVADTNEFVRSALAQNISLPNPLQFILAADSSTSVRIALTQRKTLDTDVAIHLANGDDSLVRAATILNYTGDDELLQLWADKNWEQQQLLLLRRKQAVPSSTEQALRFSTHSAVCREALRDSDLSGPEMLYLAQSDDTRDRLFLAEYANLPTSVQRLLAQDASPQVRRRLAANNLIAESIALHIAASNDLSATRALAKNPATSDTALRELSLHADESIALLVAYRDDLQTEHYDLLINHRETQKVAEHIAYQEIRYNNFSENAANLLASNEAPTVRAFAAASARLNESTRNALLRDPSKKVRLRLAQNTALSEQQLRILLEDPERDVAFAAEASFAKRIRGEAPPEPQPDEGQPTKGALFNKIVNFFNE